MFRIPWLSTILVCSFLSSFLSSSFMTSILQWLRLPSRAADGRPVHPFRPPPYPDPTVPAYLSIFLGSLGILFALPSTVSPWQPAGLLACLGLAWSCVMFPWQHLGHALDRFSNTAGRPLWLVRPPRHQVVSTLPFLHELFHWHGDWSFDDSLFWVLMLLFHLWSFLGGWLLLHGTCFVFHSVVGWLLWCSGSSSSSGVGLSFLCSGVSLLDRLFSSVSRGRSIFQRGWNFL